MKFPHGNEIQMTKCFFLCFCFSNKWYLNHQTNCLKWGSMKIGAPIINVKLLLLFIDVHVAYFLCLYVCVALRVCISSPSSSLESLEIHRFGGIFFLIWIDYWSPVDQWIITILSTYIKCTRWRCLIACHWQSKYIRMAFHSRFI